jgi:hypothetical protein
MWLTTLEHFRADHKCRGICRRDLPVIEKIEHFGFVLPKSEFMQLSTAV